MEVIHHLGVFLGAPPVLPVPLDSKEGVLQSSEDGMGGAIMKNLSELIEIVAPGGPHEGTQEGPFLEIKSLRGFEDLVACLLEEEEASRPDQQTCPVAA